MMSRRPGRRREGSPARRNWRRDEITS